MNDRKIIDREPVALPEFHGLYLENCTITTCCFAPS